MQEEDASALSPPLPTMQAEGASEFERDACESIIREKEEAEQRAKEEGEGKTGVDMRTEVDK